MADADVSPEEAGGYADGLMPDTISDSAAPESGAEEHHGFFHDALDTVRSKGLRYAAVSVVNVVVGQTLLILFQKAFGLDPTPANILAVCISAVPAYYLSRAWVWGKKGKSHFRSEVLPFWIFVAIGLVFSTLCVLGAHTLWVNTQGTDQPAIVTNLINMAAFGILWVFRFFLFDEIFHVEFAADESEDAEADAEAEQA